MPIRHSDSLGFLLSFYHSGLRHCAQRSGAALFVLQTDYSTVWLREAGGAFQGGDDLLPILQHKLLTAEEKVTALKKELAQEERECSRCRRALRNVRLGQYPVNPEGAFHFNDHSSDSMVETKSRSLITATLLSRMVCRF